MQRQNLYADGPWDSAERGPETGTVHRSFWRPDRARMGATLWDLCPGAAGVRYHMHYGAEEMFFVLGGRPVLRNPEGEEQLEPGDFVFCPEGRRGLHTFGNPHDEPVRLLGISAGSFPDVVAYPEHEYAWVATRDPELPPAGDPGIIARFEFRLE